MSEQTCKDCGGLHFGSGLTCPYQETVCDVCHKTLLQHPDRMFCEGGKTEHQASQKFCTCEKCVGDRMAIKKRCGALKKVVGMALLLIALCGCAVRKPVLALYCDQRTPDGKHCARWAKGDAWKPCVQTTMMAGESNCQ